MNQLKIKRNILTALIFSLILATANYAQTTEFTYQGKLSDAGGQAAAYDFVFRLCSSEADCSTPLATSTQSNVPVPGSGTFTVKLDFGAAAFDGTDRFLEIDVRRANTGNFVTLAPRQKLTSAPYAIQSVKANDALQLGGTAANQYVLTNDPRLSANNYVQNTTIAQTGVNFNVGGTGTAEILNAGTQFNLGGSRILSNQGQFNIFAGIDAGAVTTGGANAFFGGSAGKVNTTGNNNSFFGAFSGSVNTSGGFNSFFGASAGEENSTGGSNSFFGQSAGGDTTSGNLNSFVGFNAGFTNRTGGNNSALGANTTFSVNNLSFATAIGAGATVGTSNTLVLGRTNDAVQAPGSLNVGSSINAATQYNLGGSRFISNNNITSNTFVGTGSNCSNGTGTANTLIGNNTGSDCTTGAGNTVVGRDAGKFGAGFLNTLIGTRAQVAAGVTISNSTAIGVDAVVSTSNTIVLGTTLQNTLIPGEFKVIGGTNGTTDFPALMTVDSQNSNWGYGIAVGSLHIDKIPQVFLDTPLCFQAGVGVSNYKSVGLCLSTFGVGSLKTDAKPFTGGLEIVKRLQPVSFKWKENDSTGIGLNAEDVAAVDTNLISRDEKGEVMKVDENSLNAVLINAVKEQQKQIEAQQKQIEQLKKTVCAINPAANVCKEEK